MQSIRTMNELVNFERNCGDTFLIFLGANWCPPCKKLDQQLSVWYAAQQDNKSVLPMAVIKINDDNQDDVMNELYAYLSVCPDNGIPKVFLIQKGFDRQQPLPAWKRQDDQMKLYRTFDDLRPHLIA